MLHQTSLRIYTRVSVQSVPRNRIAGYKFMQILNINKDFQIALQKVCFRFTFYQQSLLESFPHPDQHEALSTSHPCQSDREKWHHFVVLIYVLISDNLLRAYCIFQ